MEGTCNDGACECKVGYEGASCDTVMPPQDLKWMNTTSDKGEPHLEVSWNLKRIAAEGGQMVLSCMFSSDALNKESKVYTVRPPSTHQSYTFTNLVPTHTYNCVAAVEASVGTTTTKSVSISHRVTIKAPEVPEKLAGKGVVFFIQTYKTADDISKALPAGITVVADKETEVLGDFIIYGVGTHSFEDLANAVESLLLQFGSDSVTTVSPRIQCDESTFIALDVTKCPDPSMADPSSAPYILLIVVGLGIAAYMGMSFYSTRESGGNNGTSSSSEMEMGALNGSSSRSSESSSRGLTAGNSSKDNRNKASAPLSLGSSSSSQNKKKGSASLLVDSDSDDLSSLVSSAQRTLKEDNGGSAVSLLEKVLSDIGIPEYGMKRYTSIFEGKGIVHVKQLQELNDRDWSNLGLPDIIEDAVRKEVDSIGKQPKLNTVGSMSLSGSRGLSSGAGAVDDEKRRVVRKVKGKKKKKDRKKKNSDSLPATNSPFSVVALSNDTDIPDVDLLDLSTPMTPITQGTPVPIRGPPSDTQSNEATPPTNGMNNNNNSATVNTAASGSSAWPDLDLFDSIAVDMPAASSGATQPSDIDFFNEIDTSTADVDPIEKNGADSSWGDGDLDLDF